MIKIDYKKELKHLYLPSAKKVQLVEVPSMQFAMIDGRKLAGLAVAESTEFQNAMTALYGISYTLKFNSKLRKVNPIDYTVMALEGLWWTESGEFDFDKDNEDWLFTMMMMQPEHITQEMFQEGIAQVREKKGDNHAFDHLRLEAFHEGLCIQIMHIGPYAEEPATIEKMESFAEENGYSYRGKHHEIYIGDPRRAKPEKLKTVLRQPVQLIGS